MTSFESSRSPAAAVILTAAACAMAVVIVTVLSCRQANPSQANASGVQRLAAQFDLPREQLDRFAAFVPPRPLPDEPRRASATSDWTSATFQAEPTMSPHFVTVVVDGHAVADGAVSVAINAGWRTETGERMMLPLPEAREPAAEARQPVHLVLTSPEANVATGPTDLLLALVGAQNLYFEHVRVQVWAGPTPSNIGSIAIVAALLLVASILALWAWPRRSET